MHIFSNCTSFLIAVTKSENCISGGLYYIAMVFLCRSEMADKFTFLGGNTGQRLLRRLVGVRKNFYHRWKDLSQLYGKSQTKSPYQLISSLFQLEQKYNFSATKSLKSKFCS